MSKTPPKTPARKKIKVASPTDNSSEPDVVLESAKKAFEKKKEGAPCNLNGVQDPNEALKIIANWIQDLQSEAGGAFISVAATYDQSPKNKFLEKKELKDMLQSLNVIGVEKNLLSRLKKAFDVDQDGQVNYFDFVRVIRTGAPIPRSPLEGVSIWEPDEVVVEQENFNYTVYWGSGSALAWRSLLVLQFLKKSYPDRIRYKSTELHFDFDKHKTPEMLAMNPRGKVPVLEDHDDHVVVYESLAIMDYLTAKEDTRHELIPSIKERKLYAKVKIRFHESEYLQQVVYKVKNLARDGKRKDHISAEIAAVEEELKRWDEYLGESKFVAGEQLSLADLAIFPFLATLARLGHTFSTRSNIKQYYAALIKKESCVKQTWPPHWDKPSGKKVFE